MTSPLRKKRRIIPLLGLTLASLLGVCLKPGHAQTLPNSARVPRAMPRRHTEGLDEARQRVRSLTNRAHLLAVRMQRDEADDVRTFKAELDPPTREQLFSIGAESAVFDSMRQQFQKQDKNLIFLIPGPTDNFDNPDTESGNGLGTLWRQRYKGDAADLLRGDKVGVMGIKAGKGYYPLHMPKDGKLVEKEAAIMTEAVDGPDMLVQVDVNLGSPESEFGIVVRAENPDTFNDPEAKAGPVDQINVNSFYFAIVSGSQAAIGKRVKGQTTQLRTVPLESKTSFVLTVTAVGDRIAVQRDGTEVMTVVDGALTGRHAGLIGTRATQRPTEFDRFRAISYGGPYVARAYEPSSMRFEGPNVHYRPLYFEDAALERYGHHMGNLFQPLLSSATFFVDVVALPYSLAKTPPWECISNEGYHRPGDVVLPFVWIGPGWDAQGAALETGMAILAFSLLP